LLSGIINENGLSINSIIYDSDGNLVGTVKNNGYSVNVESKYVTEVTGDLSTLIVHEKTSGRELLYVKFLNPAAIRVRGLFYCPVMDINKHLQVLSLPIVDDKPLTIPGHNTFGCLAGGAGISIE
jgi:hypothetical protein